MDTEIRVLQKNVDTLQGLLRGGNTAIELMIQEHLAEDRRIEAVRVEENRRFIEILDHKMATQAELGLKIRSMNHEDPDYENTRRKAEAAVKAVGIMIWQYSTLIPHRREEDESLQRLRIIKVKICAASIEAVASRLRKLEADLALAREAQAALNTCVPSVQPSTGDGRPTVALPPLMAPLLIRFWNLIRLSSTRTLLPTPKPPQ